MAGGALESFRNFRIEAGGISWQSSGEGSTLSLQWARVQSLIGELRSHKLCGTAPHTPKKDGGWEPEKPSLD